MKPQNGVFVDVDLSSPIVKSDPQEVVRVLRMAEHIISSELRYKRADSEVATSYREFIETVNETIIKLEGGAE